jgi:hypothetical protein
MVYKLLLLLLLILCHFKFITRKITIVGARAALCYDSGSDRMMRLLAAPQHCFVQGYGNYSQSHFCQIVSILSG